MTEQLKFTDIIDAEQFEEAKRVASQLLLAIRDYDAPLSTAQMLLATAMVAAGLICHEEDGDGDITMPAFRRFYDQLLETSIKSLQGHSPLQQNTKISEDENYH